MKENPSTYKFEAGQKCSYICYCFEDIEVVLYDNCGYI
jgi:hypothetical protein